MCVGDCVCRPAAGPCDVAEQCTAQGICPDDGLVSAGTLCRQVTGQDFCYFYGYMALDLPEHPAGSQRGACGVSVIVRI